MKDRSIEDRVLKVEWTVEDHDRLITDLRQEAVSVSQDIRAIQSTLAQIKWFAMGALALYASDTLGLSQLIKLIG